MFQPGPPDPSYCGWNCAVVKPSEIAPATAKAIQDLLPKYLDNHCFKVWSRPPFKLTFLISLKFPVQMCDDFLPRKFQTIYRMTSLVSKLFG